MDEREIGKGRWKKVEHTVEIIHLKLPMNIGHRDIVLFFGTFTQ